MIERLTNRNESGIAYVKIPANPSNMIDVGECYTGRIIDRLAAYEDTGLTPDEILELKRECEITAESESALWGANKHLEAQIEAMKMDIDQLKSDNANLEMNLQALTSDKDELAGRIMRYDTVLKLAKEALKLLHPKMNPDEPCFVYEAWQAINALLGGKEKVSEIGKTVFLTREEAEKALQEGLR